MSTSLSEKNPEPASPHTQGAFQKSELAGWTLARLVTLTMKQNFYKEFLLKNHLLLALQTPCYNAHPDNMNTAKSQAKTNIITDVLPKINFRFYRLLVMKTLT